MTLGSELDEQANCFKIGKNDRANLNSNNVKRESQGLRV
jgi:hypothetical protein